MDAPTILVVEDDSAVRQGVVDALTYAGYAELSEGDGEVGRATALRANYQLLLLDLVLPGCSGFAPPPSPGPGPPYEPGL